MMTAAHWLSLLLARRGLSMMTAAHWLSLLLFPFLLARSDNQQQCNPGVYNLSDVKYPSGYDKTLNMSIGFYCADRQVCLYICFRKPPPDDNFVLSAERWYVVQEHVDLGRFRGQLAVSVLRLVLEHLPLHELQLRRLCAGVRRVQVRHAVQPHE